MKTAFTCGLMIAISAFSPLSQAGDRQEDRFEYARRAIVGQKTTQPIGGYIPDALTAIVIAKALLTPVYGQGQVTSEEPFKAELKDDTWTVLGTLNSSGPGGMAIVQLRKSTGAVEFLSHFE